MTAALAVVAGAVFALGLALSDMTSPARVIGFLDVTGAWDATLAFVMAGAIAVFAPIARLAKGASRPWRAARFYWPERKDIDPRLVIGSALFGVGWGLSGYCPGPALVSLGEGELSVALFVLAMIAGIAITRRLMR